MQFQIQGIGSLSPPPILLDLRVRPLGNQRLIWEESSGQYNEMSPAPSLKALSQGARLWLRPSGHRGWVTARLTPGPLALLTFH